MMIKISKCKDCLRCCHGEPGKNIAAKLNSGTQPKITKTGTCEQLARTGACRLGSYKPVECSLYPIVIKHDGLYVDTKCPGHLEAVEYVSKLIGKYETYEQDCELLKI